MPPDFVLFLDENHCNNKHVLNVLTERGIQFERYSQHFLPGIPDADWLPEIGKRNWSLLTTDRRIRYRALEKQAVRENEIRMFCFSTNNMSGREMAEALGKALGKMIRIAGSNRPPFIAMTTRSGDVHLRERFGAE
jgi:PIN like domain